MFHYANSTRVTAAKNIRVLFVEDDSTLREATVQGLELEGYEVDAFGDATAALRILDADYPGVIVSDVRLPGMDGLKFFEQVKRVDAEMPLIFTTGHGDVAMAVEAMKSGAVLSKELQKNVCWSSKIANCGSNCVTATHPKCSDRQMQPSA